MDTTGNSPWHEGEKMMQERVGLVGPMDDIGRRAIRDHMGEAHRNYYMHQSTAVFGTVDHNGDAWATILYGLPGFLNPFQPTTLRVTKREAPGDPAVSGIHDGAGLGMLAIDLRTRRRSRLNGTVLRVNEPEFDIEVEQCYGNCPQYIHRREFTLDYGPRLEPFDVQVSNELDGRSKGLISNADTLFVASYLELADGRRKVDVSHKAGHQGFVHFQEDDLLVIPDYSGNNYFNTLGNMLLNPRCGVSFIDFSNGDMLQLTGHAMVLQEREGVQAYPEADRVWTFRVHQAVYRSRALPFTAGFSGSASFFQAGLQK